MSRYRNENVILIFQKYFSFKLSPDALGRFQMKGNKNCLTSEYLKHVLSTFKVKTQLLSGKYFDSIERFLNINHWISFFSFFLSSFNMDLYSWSKTIFQWIVIDFQFREEFLRSFLENYQIKHSWGRNCQSKLSDCI